MNDVSLRVCIVTTAHLCDNPRVVKEADALDRAGHEVRVVAQDRHPEGTALDADMMRERRWRLITVRVPSRRRRQLYWVIASMLERAARRATFAYDVLPWLRDFAASKYCRLYTTAACREPADLVIAHHAPALPAAARAARRLGARLAFDAEDLHAEELPNRPEFARDRALITAVEEAYLPLCDRISASSQPIADELVRRYGVRTPTVVLNVFSSADRASTNGNVVKRRPDVPSLYWFSQTIGPDRGIEDALRAMALLGRPAELHLRGTIATSYAAELHRLAASLGLENALRLWPRAAPADLVALAREHDVGLALEPPVCLNKELCVSNKLLMYLVAGLAVAATDTPGQRMIMAEIPKAGFVFAPGDVRAFADGLAEMLASPERLASAKRAAEDAALSRFCWDREQDVLLEHLTQIAPNGLGQARYSAEFQHAS